jgi:hypothetical protein
MAKADEFEIYHVPATTLLWVRSKCPQQFAEFCTFSVSLASARSTNN